MICTNAQGQDNVGAGAPGVEAPKRAKHERTLIAPGVHHVELDDLDEEPSVDESDKDAISL